MSFSTVVVTDGLIRTEAGYAPHPELLPWLKPLQRSRQRWFESALRTPLGWYAWLQHEAPAALLAAALPSDHAFPFAPVHYWVASPCSLQLSRDRVRVMPEVLLPFDERDAAWLCETLNPLLAEDEMQLVAAGRALCLVSGRHIDVQPTDFAHVNGHTLPNRSPEGADGAAWMRLQAEIQMLLHQAQPPHRQGMPPLQSLWFWGGSDCAASVHGPLPVATRNAVLAAVADARDAQLCISEADALAELLGHHGSPRHWLLAGDGHAVALKETLLPWPRGKGWKPRGAQPSEALRELLL